jgi:hypothetical protein
MLGGAKTCPSDYNNTYRHLNHVLLHHIGIQNARQEIFETWQLQGQKGRSVSPFTWSETSTGSISAPLQLMLRKVTAER